MNSSSSSSSQPPRPPPIPECTSTTNHVHVKGVSILEDFITPSEEEELLSHLDSSPWEESISRRVQHYGFSFNYRTLMLDYAAETPPLPPLCVKVRDRIEETFAGADNTTDTPASTSAGESAGDRPKNYYKLTQLTVNEYLPGQGIAPHIDTELCLGPIIYVLNLGGGIVLTLKQKKLSSSMDGKSGEEGGDDEALQPSTNELQEEAEEGDQQNDTNHSTSSSSSSSSSSASCIGRKKHLWLPPRSLLVLQDDSRYLWSHGIASRIQDQVNGVLIPRTRRVSLTFRHALIPGEIHPHKLTKTHLEQDHVFRVYDNIAIHWNHTRGKRKVHWHRVKAYLEALPKGSFVADIGCGDGKYFGVNPDIYVIGCDRSAKLLQVSQDKNYETFCCDAVKLPFRSGIFDAALCIAVLHHLSTVGRRTAVIRELVRITKPGGSVMVQAWALEQGEDSRHNFEQQDVMVPWRLAKRFFQPGQSLSEDNETPATIDGNKDTDNKDNDKDRERQAADKDSNGSNNDDEKKIPSNHATFNIDDTVSPEGPCEHVVEERNFLIFQRYCHVYKENELRDLCSSVAGCRVLECGWDKGNWFVHLLRIEDERLDGALHGPVGGVPRMATRL